MADATTKSRGPYTGKWYDDRNERRKNRYHSDDNYRTTANKAARDGYRSTRGKSEPLDPRKNLTHLAEIGKVRLLENGEGKALTFSKAEVADVFERPTKQIQQWAADGRIPPTAIKAKVEGVERNWLDVYSEAEVRAIVEALGPFLSELIYFRCDHVDAITAVHDAVVKVRQG